MDAASKLIAGSFPDLTVERISPLGEGEDSTAWLVNDELVFRFPKHDNASVKMKREADALPLLRPLIALEIPDFEYIGEDPETGFVFVGYRIIKGVDLTRERFAALDEEDRDAVLDQIAEFFASVNAFPTDEAEKFGTPHYNCDTEYVGLMERARQRCYPYLNASGQTLCEEAMAAFLERDQEGERAPAFLHADLGQEHMIFDEASRRIVGIIDWADMVIEDPDYEFHWLFDEFGRRFVQDIADRMGVETGQRFWDKQRAYVIANELGGALFYLSQNDFANFRRDLGWIEKRV